MMRDLHEHNAIDVLTMKLWRKLYSPRGVFVILLFFWGSFIFLKHQTNNPTTPDDIESRLYAEAPPIIRSKISGSVAEVSEDRAGDCAFVRKGLPLEEPFIVRGMMQYWPAIQKWNFQWVHDIDVEADVLTSGSLKFMYYNATQGEEILRTTGPSALPAVMTEMGSQEAIERMTTSGSELYPKLYYNKDTNSREFYYIRFDTEDDMEQDFSLDHDLFRCLTPLRGERPRLWISVQGSISPMHWDGRYSCLIQVHGTKRMLLYSPDYTYHFGTYPRGHLLWRRSKFDPTDPDYESYPSAKQIGGSLALLDAGDVLCFPSGWLHYTDCLTHSISLTLRYAL